MGAVPKDVNKTMSLIIEFMPELRFTKDDLINGNPLFVCEFFRLFINEMKETVATMFNEDFGPDECFQIEGFSDEVSLYCSVAKVLQHFAQFIPCPTLVDFYVPNKKMYSIVKFCINLIIYTNGGYADVASLLNNQLKKLCDNAQFGEMKEKYLEAISETAENLAKIGNSVNKMKTSLKAVIEEHEDIRTKADSTAKMTVQKKSECSQLKTEVDALEVKLQHVEEAENEFQVCIVSPIEYEELVNNEKYFLNKLQEVNTVHDDLCTNLEKEANMLRFFQENDKLFFCIDLDSFDSNKCDIVKKEIREKVILLQKMEEDVVDLEEKFTATVSRIENIKKKLDVVSKSETDLNEKFTMQKEKEERIIKEEIDKQSVMFFARQKKVSETLKLKENLQELAGNDKHLTSFVISEYNRILQENKKTTDAFYEMLCGISDC